MARDRAVRGLILRRAVRRDEHGGHHGERAEGRGDHVAHHVAVIVLAGPDKAAAAADDAGDRIVDQGIEIHQSQRLKLRFVGLLVFLLKNALERAVVDLGDGVLGGEPEVLLRVDGILEAGLGERADARFLVVLTLEDGRAVDLLDEDGLLLAGHAAEGHGALAGLVGGKAHGFIDVAVGVAGDGDGLFPVAHDRLDGIEQDRRAKDRAVQDGADGAVRAFPHLGQLRVLGHPLGIRRDRRAFDGHTVFSRGQRRVDGDLILRLVAVQQAKVIILGLQLDERADQLVLDHLPEDSGHFVAVHLDERRFHLDLFHAILLIRAWRSSSSDSRRAGSPARHRSGPGRAARGAFCSRRRAGP